MNGSEWFPEAAQRLSQELADPDAPYLGAHVVSEFIYCPRAGIVTFEQRNDDVGSDLESAPNLGGLPPLSLTEIEASLVRLRDKLKLAVAWGFGLVVLTLLGVFSFGWFILFFCAVPLYVTGRCLNETLHQYVALRALREDALSAAVREPDWSLRQPQPINWWCLLRAGFASHEPVSPLVDRDLHLAGKPFRILQRGATHVPVMLVNVNDAEDDLRRQGRLRPPQRARLAAYAYLLHQVQRTQTDWAIVLFKGSFDGVAVPIDQTMLRLFSEGLVAARVNLTESQSQADYSPHPTRGTSPCVNCPHGKPTKDQESFRFRGVPVTQFYTSSRDGTLFHSACGDRFRWVPPHTDASKLGLTPEKFQ